MALISTLYYYTYTAYFCFDIAASQVLLLLNIHAFHIYMLWYRTCFNRLNFYLTFQFSKQTAPLQCLKYRDRNWPEEW